MSCSRDTGALARLCPQVAEAEEERERRMREENDAYIAAAEKNCSAHPRHRPKIKLVRQVRATTWTTIASATVSTPPSNRSGDGIAEPDDDRSNVDGALMDAFAPVASRTVCGSGPVNSVGVLGLPDCAGHRSVLDASC
jgi:hypothetical protein